MYSQGNVRAGKVLRPPIRALPSVIVDTEKVLREADGSMKLVVVRPDTDGKVIAPGAPQKLDGDEPVRSPKIISDRQYCYVGNTAKQCRLGLFQDSDFAGDLEDSKSTSRGTLCIFGSHTFVPISWMCKKQTAVSHSSTESEIISLDTGLRLDCLPALELWDLIVSVLEGSLMFQIDQGNLIMKFTSIINLKR